jgi:hypothetical protein
VAADNPFLQMQQQFSDVMVKSLDAWRDARDQLYERTFLSIYSSPVLQAMLGIAPEWSRPRAGHSPLYDAFVEAKKAELRSRMGEGGLREALLRALLHVVSAFGGADERTFEAIRRIRAEHPECKDTSLQEFKRALREQFYMLLIDRETALQAIPKLLPKEMDVRRRALDVLARSLPRKGRRTRTCINECRRSRLCSDCVKGRRALSSSLLRVEAQNGRHAEPEQERRESNGQS